jgi:hypothetical protein
MSPKKNAQFAEKSFGEFMRSCTDAAARASMARAIRPFASCFAATGRLAFGLIHNPKIIRTVEWRCVFN